MKIFLLTFLLSSTLGFGQTLKDNKTREKILTRIDSLQLLFSEASEALIKEDVTLACQKIENAFEIMPDHLVSIGTKMNLLNGKVIKMEQETKISLIQLHRLKNTCHVGEYGENLDLKITKKHLKDFKKLLGKQSKFIKSADLSYENYYYYSYQFN